MSVVFFHTSSFKYVQKKNKNNKPYLLMSYLLLFKSLIFKTKAMFKDSSMIRMNSEVECVSDYYEAVQAYCLILHSAVCAQ